MELGWWDSKRERRSLLGLSDSSSSSSSSSSSFGGGSCKNNFTGSESSSGSSGSTTTDLWWVGAIIYIFGSITVNLGNNLIRLSHERNDRLTTLAEERKPVYKRPLWLSGFGLFLIGNVCNFVGFMFAAQSLLSALGSVQFLSNLFFAALVNKERITRIAIVATGFIIAGNVAIVLNGPHTTKDLSVSELLDHFILTSFIIYVSCVLGAVATIQAISSYFQWKLRFLSPDDSPSPFMLRFLPFAYAAVSAMLGSFSVLLGKATSGLVKGAFSGVNECHDWDDPFAYVILLGFFLIVAFWVYRMNTALRLFPALFIIPVLQVIWLVFSIVGGGIYFQEFTIMTTPDLLWFGCGFLLLVFGVAMLSMMVDSNKVAGKGGVVESTEPPPKSPEKGGNSSISSSHVVSSSSTTLLSSEIGREGEEVEEEEEEEEREMSMTSALVSASTYSSYRDMPYMERTNTLRRSRGGYPASSLGDNESLVGNSVLRGGTFHGLGRSYSPIGQKPPHSQQRQQQQQQQQTPVSPSHPRQQSSDTLTARSDPQRNRTWSSFANFLRPSSPSFSSSTTIETNPSGGTTTPTRLFDSGQGKSDTFV